MLWNYKTNDIITVNDHATGYKTYDAVVINNDKATGTVTVQMVYTYCTNNTPDNIRKVFGNCQTVLNQKLAREYMKFVPKGRKIVFKWNHKEGRFLNKDNQRLYHYLHI